MLKEKILIVDDMPINRGILVDILEDEFNTAEASNGREAIEYIEAHHSEICAVLLDLMMPDIDGYAVLEYLNEKHYLKNFPVLIITGEDSLKIEKDCFDLGVSDFIRKPFDNKLVLKRVKNVTELFAYKNKLEERVEVQTQKLRSQYSLLEKQAAELKKNNTNIIDIVGSIVECRDLESGEHIQRVKGYTRILANQVKKDYPEYKLSKHKIDVIVAASALHDVGKIAIPDNVLLKPGRLTKEEFELMKTHTTRGFDMLQMISGAWGAEYGKYSSEICRHHHERYDGKGYPDGYAGDEIPISAQLVSIADVYDALVNVRCYKDAYSHEKAYEMIVKGECGTFSPKLLEAFKKTRRQFEALADSLKEK